MLHLKTASGERLEIPATCINAVMQPCDGVNPCAIIFDFGANKQIEQLSDQYGFVKKAVIDSMAMINPVEVRVLEQVGEKLAEGRMFLSRDRILGRREVKHDASGIHARLFVDLLAKPISINIADTLDELDGVQAPKEGTSDDR